jgi:hypothetical protein
MKVTLRRLKAIACPMACQEFEELFGKEAEVNRKNANIALKSCYLSNPIWIDGLLPKKAKDEFWDKTDFGTSEEEYWKLFLRLIKKYGL